MRKSTVKASCWLAFAAMGTVVSGCGENAPAPPSDQYPVGALELGSLDNYRGTGWAIANAIKVVRPLDEATGTFAYLTGGEQQPESPPAGDGSDTIAAPTRIVAEESVGAVTVRIRTEDPATDLSAAAANALVVANGIHSATTSIWPAARIPAIVDIHLVPQKNVRYALGRHVEWKEGEPFRLAIFRPDLLSHPHTAAHELYHVLAARHVLARHGEEGAERAHTATNYEEIAADLYGRCAVLLAKGSTPLVDPTFHAFAITINGRSLRIPLANHELRYIVDMLRATDQAPQPDSPGTVFARVLAPVVLLSVRDDDSTNEPVHLSSAAGRRLIDLCKEIAPDPMRLDSWFEQASALSQNENRIPTR